MTVPLAMIGVVLVLWLAAIPVTIMVFLGLIILVVTAIYIRITADT